MQRALSVFGAILALAGAPMGAGAQQLDRPRFTAAGGLDLRRAGDDPTALAQVGLQWQKATSALGGRVEVLYARRVVEYGTEAIFGLGRFGVDRGLPALDTLAFPLPLPFGVALRSELQSLGVLPNGSYEFARGTQVRPYLVSGVGIAQTWRRLETRFSCDPLFDGVPGAPCPPVFGGISFGRSRTALAMALTAGAGLTFDLGRLQLFGELRYYLTDEGGAGAAPSNALSGAVPVTVGVRF